MNIKKTIAVTAGVCLLYGCAGSQETEPQPQEEHTDEAYVSYVRDVETGRPENFTAAARIAYDMKYEEDILDRYSMDEVLEMQEDTAHIRQNIDGNGVYSSIEGYYFDGKLYNTYNGITYYEPMEPADVQAMMLVPVSPYAFPEKQIGTISLKEDENGKEYRIRLKEESAADILFARYDIYGLNKYKNLSVKDHSIAVRFDEKGTYKGETASFTVELEYEKQKIEVSCQMNMDLLKTNETEVVITDEMKDTFRQYISYEDIDPSSIDEGEYVDDTEEDTALATFEKRLVSRLNYKAEGNGIYRNHYNETEEYRVDIANSTFQYANYSIVYTYNWKGDIAAFSGCTYDFKNDKASSGCEDEVVEKMKTVKSYLEMELYYCGLSLDEIQKETQASGS